MNMGLTVLHTVKHLENTESRNLSLDCGLATVAKRTSYKMGRAIKYPMLANIKGSAATADNRAI